MNPIDLGIKYLMYTYISPRPKKNFLLIDREFQIPVEKPSWALVNSSAPVSANVTGIRA